MQAAELADQGEPFVLATVVCTEGSTPREPGAKMIWRPGHDLVGTVGGGQFEHMVIASAESVFTSRGAASERFVLGADADQCCGGTVEVFLEFIGPRQRVILFGGGHVSQAVAGMLRPASLQIIVADDRPSWASLDRFPGCRVEHDYARALSLAREQPGATLVCVMTCSHDTDLHLLRELLPIPLGFIGLIGSKSKRACFVTRLAASGVSREAIARLKCPIGLGDMGKAPELVAVSVAAQLLTESRSLAAL